MTTEINGIDTLDFKLGIGTETFVPPIKNNLR